MANPVSVAIKVPPKAHEVLFREAKRLGYGSAAAYAQLLFDAAFAARVGQMRDAPATDADLDDQVRLVFALAGQANTAAIARATGLPEARVTRILDGFRTVAKTGAKT